MGILTATTIALLPSLWLCLPDGAHGQDARRLAHQGSSLSESSFTTSLPIESQRTPPCSTRPCPAGSTYGNYKYEIYWVTGEDGNTDGSAIDAEYQRFDSEMCKPDGWLSGNPGDGTMIAVDGFVTKLNVTDSTWAPVFHGSSAVVGYPGLFHCASAVHSQYPSADAATFAHLYSCPPECVEDSSCSWECSGGCWAVFGMSTFAPYVFTPGMAGKNLTCSFTALPPMPPSPPPPPPPMAPGLPATTIGAVAGGAVVVVLIGLTVWWLCCVKNKGCRAKALALCCESQNTDGAEAKTEANLPSAQPQGEAIKV